MKHVMNNRAQQYGRELFTCSSHGSNTNTSKETRSYIRHCGNLTVVVILVDLQKSNSMSSRSLAFKLSGNSERPAYPGFIVIKTEQVGSNLISVPSKSSVLAPELIPLHSMKRKHRMNIFVIDR